MYARPLTLGHLFYLLKGRLYFSQLAGGTLDPYQIHIGQHLQIDMLPGLSIADLLPQSGARRLQVIPLEQHLGKTSVKIAGQNGVPAELLEQIESRQALLVRLAKPAGAQIS